MLHIEKRWTQYVPKLNLFPPNGSGSHVPTSGIAASSAQSVTMSRTCHTLASFAQSYFSFLPCFYYCNCSYVCITVYRLWNSPTFI